MEERSPARSPVSFASGYADAPAPLLVCFSHLRWDFVWQRPQHLLSRAAKYYRVLQIEGALLGLADLDLHAVHGEPHLLADVVVDARAGPVRRTGRFFRHSLNLDKGR